MFFLFRLSSSLLFTSSSGLLVERESGGFLGVSCDCLCVCVEFAVLVVVFAVRSSGLEIPIFTYLVLFFPGVGNVAGECPRP